MHKKIFLLIGLAITGCSDSREISESKDVSDIQSMSLRPDGQYDVRCRDGRLEVRSAQDIRSGVVCETGGGGGGGGAGTITNTYTTAIDGGLVDGTTDVSRQTAQERYNRACDDFVAQTRQYNRSQSQIQSLSCGTSQETGGSGGYRYQSNGSVVIRLPSANSTQAVKVSGQIVAGTTAQSRDEAFASYQGECRRQHESLSLFRGVFYFLCGTIQEVGGNSGYRYTSDGQLIYSSAVSSQNNETINGQFVSGTTTESSKQAYQSWQSQCTRWLNTQSIGNTVVAFCGDTSEVGGSSGYQYRSTGTSFRGL